MSTVSLFGNCFIIYGFSGDGYENLKSIVSNNSLLKVRNDLTVREIRTVRPPGSSVNWGAW